MDKITKSFRVKAENVNLVVATAKKERRNIGDQLDMIIEFYYANKTDD
jgi:hypothetical protein